MQALNELVERRDPVKKAERVINKNIKKLLCGEALPDSSTDSEEGTALKQSGHCPVQTYSREGTALKQSGRKGMRVRVSATTKHQVWQRGGGYCTHEFSKGYPCGSRMMLELDHIVPVDCRCPMLVLLGSLKVMKYRQSDQRYYTTLFFIDVKSSCYTKASLAWDLLREACPRSWRGHVFSHFL